MLEARSENLYEHHRIEVDKNQKLLRIDKFLINKLPNASRNKLQIALKEGHVLVNGQVVKQNYKVRFSDIITIELPDIPREVDILPENIPLDIVFEDDFLLIVNKQAGMVVHPAYNNWNGTLVNALIYHLRNLPEMEGNKGRPGLVHRIDKDTSGLLVIAKTEEAMTGLAKQFFDHSIERTYYALIWGEPKEDNGTIDVNLGRSFKDRRITTAFPEADFGRRSVSHYKVLKYLRYVSLVQCKLETGRTHQIRAHFKYLGHPLFNDATYGGAQIVKGNQFTKYKAFVNNCFKAMPRQALHAKSLGFIHPITKQQVQFDSNLPDDFKALIHKWENYVKHH